jgi:protein phosphatase
MIRELNEDGYLVLAQPAIAPELNALLVVADGMGGHQAGDVASSEAIRYLNELFSSSVYQEQVGYSQERDDYFVVVLKEILEQINDRLYNIQGGRPDLQGMGTTGSVALFVNQHLYIGHVGDSRIYRLRGGEIRQLTTDHTWVSEQVAAGVLTPQEALVHPNRNLLTRCLGHSPVLRVERTAHQVQLGDTLLLCSDGLTGVVQDTEVSQVVRSYPSPQEACDALVELANHRGGPDNITVLIAHALEGAGNDLPGGRAYGPRGEEAESEQADTVKLARRKPDAPELAAPSPEQAAAPSPAPLAAPTRAGPARPGRGTGRLLLVAAFGVAVALACGFLGMTGMERLFTTSSTLRALHFLVLFIATVIGIVIGLVLSSLLHRDSANSTGDEATPVEKANSRRA